MSNARLVDSEGWNEYLAWQKTQAFLIFGLITNFDMEKSQKLLVFPCLTYLVQLGWWHSRPLRSVRKILPPLWETRRSNRPRFERTKEIRRHSHEVFTNSAVIISEKTVEETRRLFASAPYYEKLCNAILVSLLQSTSSLGCCDVLYWRFFLKSNLGTQHRPHARHEHDMNK